MKTKHYTLVMTLRPRRTLTDDKLNYTNMVLTASLHGDFIIVSLWCACLKFELTTTGLNRRIGSPENGGENILENTSREKICTLSTKRLSVRAVW